MSGVLASPPVDRISARCTYEDRGYKTLCLIFNGALNSSGYGLISNGKRASGSNRASLVHRLMYEGEHGTISDGLELDHLCRTPACCNPDHLEAVTHAENCRRGLSGERNRARASVITHCPMGHEYTPDNTRLTANRNGSLCRGCRRCDSERSSRRWREMKKARVTA